MSKIRDAFWVSSATLIALGFALAFELTPLAARPMMIVANPFSGASALQLIAESGGVIVAPGPLSWIAFGTDAGDGGFGARLAGRALLILRGDVAGSCSRKVAR